MTVVFPLAGSRSVPRPNGAAAHDDPEPYDEDELRNDELDAIALEEDHRHRKRHVVETFAEFVAREIQPPAWHISNVLRELSISAIVAEPKSLKTTLMATMVVSLASGTTLLDRFSVPRACTVIVDQREHAIAAWQQKLRRIAGDTAPAGLLVVSSRLELALEDDESAARYEREVLEPYRPPRGQRWALVLDPYASFTDVDENSASETRRVVRRLRDWRDRLGLTILLVHHARKRSALGGKTVRGGVEARGSNAFYAAIEAGIYVDRPDDSVPRATVRVELKEDASPPPFDVELGDDGRLRLVESGQVTDEQLVDAVASKGYATAAVVATFFSKAETGIKRRLDQLVKAGRLVSIAGAGTKPTQYRLTDVDRVARTVQNTWSAEREA